MNNKEREDIALLARKGVGVDKIKDMLVGCLFAEPAPGSKIPGIKFTKTAQPALLFEVNAHHVTMLARYVHRSENNEIVGRVYFCRQQLDGSVGDALLQVEIRANGDVEFPDKEALNLWPQNDPNPDDIRIAVSYQLLKATQSSLGVI
jgi:hypothetical protein